MFYAVRNNAIVGFDYQGIAFKSKAQRDSFCWNVPNFEAVPAKEARNLKQFKFMRRYPQSIYNEKGILQGIALFTTDGSFSHIA